jgi:septal ring factor EnvC (AmiA/AmiB activator)
MKKSIPEQTFAERVSASIGSTTSLVVHTIAFLLFFVLIGIGYSAERLLLILTTLVSLEAIYLAIFIQMSVNKNTASLEEVEEDLEELSDDIEEVTESLEEVEEGLEEISDDIEDIQEGIDEIEEDIEEIEEDIEEDNKQDATEQEKNDKKFQDVQATLENILIELQALKK